MSGISAIYFLDRRGRIIIFRNYRGEVNQDISDNFIQQVLELDEANMKPTFTINNVHYCWIAHQNIYIVTVSKRNINIALVFAFLYKLKSILIDYFTSLEEETIRDNFVLIYELLDEIMDHGYPTATESTILKNFITTESNVKESKNKEQSSNAISQILTNVVSWRNSGIKYNNNEFYVDIIEHVDMLISNNGTVLQSQIRGVAKAKSCLSGMPTVTLGLNDKVLFELSGRDSTNTVEMDDLKFHQCVDKKTFDKERTIQFIPPDGEFELMSYRIDTHLRPLISVELKIETISETKMEYNVKTRANFKGNSIANDVDIFIPAPSDIQNAIFKTSHGKVVFLSDREDLRWKIPKLIGLSEYSMTCTFKLPTVRIEDPDKHLKRPIQVNFSIPYFTVSGLQVRYIKTEDKAKYNAVPWVRYITKNGDYSLRII